MSKIKILKPYFPVFIFGILMTACSENDPLDELGVLQDKVPFVDLTSVDALYDAGDTINYNVLYWSDRDDIASLSTLIDGQTQLLGTLSVDDGAGEVALAFDTVFVRDSPLQSDLEHDPLDYRTDLNQYVKSMGFTIPEAYQLWEIAGADNESFLKVNELSFGSEIRSLILSQLQQNGITTTWDDLAGITTSAELKIESTLDIWIRVNDQQGNFNESSVSSAKIGPLAE